MNQSDLVPRDLCLEDFFRVVFIEDLQEKVLISLHQITIILKSDFVVLQRELNILDIRNSKDKTKVHLWRKSFGMTSLKTRLLSSATSNDNPLAPGPRDVLCPEVIYSFVLQGTKTLRSKDNLRLAGWATGCESLPHLKAPLADSLKFASQLREKLRSDFFKLWAWHKEMFHRDIFVPVTMVAFWTSFSLLTTNCSLVGFTVCWCTERKTSFVKWRFCPKRVNIKLFVDVELTLSSKWMSIGDVKRPFSQATRTKKVTDLLTYHQFLITDIDRNLWKSVRRFNITILKPLVLELNLGTISSRVKEWSFQEDVLFAISIIRFVQFSIEKNQVIYLSYLL